jgi:hypothetical protein
MPPTYSVEILGSNGKNYFRAFCAPKSQIPSICMQYKGLGKLGTF